LPFRVI